MWNSQLVAAGVTIDGGDGGIGSGSGGNGGDGVMLNDAISSCSLRDTTYVTGSGAAGQVGDGLDGQHALNSGGAPIQFFSEPHRSLSSSQAPVRPGDVYTLDYELQAGDLAVVFVAHLPIHELLPNLRGVLFVSPPFLIAVPLPAGVGPQSLALTTPPMPPALDHYEVYVQLIASAGAGLLLGPGTVLSAVP